MGQQLRHRTPRRASASTNAYAIFGWDDTRNTDSSNPAYLAGFGSGTQDIYTAAVQFSVVGGGGSNTAKVVLASALGLLAVGLVLLVVALAAKRRTGPAPTKKAVGEQSASKVG